MQMRLVLAVVIALTATACERAPAPAPDSFRAASFEVTFPDGSVRMIPSAIITPEFFPSVQAKASKGVLLSGANFAQSDEPWTRSIVIAEQLARDLHLEWRVASCITVHGTCETVSGTLSDSFNTPRGTLLWAAADLRSFAAKTASDTAHRNEITRTASQMCQQVANSAPETSRPVSGPLVVAISPNWEVPYFRLNKADFNILDERQAKNRWGISNYLTSAANQKKWRWREASSGMPRAIACVTATRSAVPGRQIVLFSRTKPSEPVYEVEWRIHVLDWMTGSPLAAKRFRSVPKFKALSGVSRDVPVVAGEGEQYGDPSAEAEAWLQSLGK